MKHSFIGDIELLKEMNGLIYHGNDIRPVWAGAGIPTTTVPQHIPDAHWSHMHLMMYYGFIHKFLEDKLDDELYILDTACGVGHAAVTMADMFPNSTFEGLDLSEVCIDFANKHNNAHNVNYTLDNAITKKYDKKFDYIFCLETLEHIYPAEHPQFMQNLLDNLKEDGILFLSTPTNSNDDADEVGGGHVGTLNNARAKDFFERYEHLIIDEGFFIAKQLMTNNPASFMTTEPKENYARSNAITHFRFVMKAQ